MKKIVEVKNIKIGGNNPIAIQSMTNTDTLNSKETINQINSLFLGGCDIVRIAVSSFEEVNSCKEIIKNTNGALVADIQFDYKIAVACADIGFSKIRFNPGNIGSDLKVKEVVAACKKNSVPIRIGVNAGSLEKNILAKYGRSAKALAVSAMNNVLLLEKFNFQDIIISVKSSDVKVMCEANRLIDKECDYPLHIGVTESGAYEYGLVKSSIGIGSLLIDGIGNTIRVSLTGDPLQEITAAKLILQSVGLDENFCEIISCPTCSRCKYDIMSVIDSVKEMTKNIKKKMKIAVMGCVVNGPGEAADADIGVAGGKEKSIIFKKGKVISTVDNIDIIPTLKKLIEEM